MNMASDLIPNEEIEAFHQGMPLVGVVLPKRVIRENVISLEDAIRYEVHAAWWPQFVSWRWAQSVVGRYFALSVGRKHAAYIKSISINHKLKQDGLL